jgi:hypothetical protein
LRVRQHLDVVTADTTVFQVHGLYWMCSADGPARVRFRRFMHTATASIECRRLGFCPRKSPMSVLAKVCFRCSSFSPPAPTEAHSLDTPSSPAVQPKCRYMSRCQDHLVRQSRRRRSASTASNTAKPYRSVVEPSTQVQLESWHLHENYQVLTTTHRWTSRCTHNRPLISHIDRISVVAHRTARFQILSVRSTHVVCRRTMNVLDCLTLTRFRLQVVQPARLLRCVFLVTYCFDLRSSCPKPAPPSLGRMLKT